MKKFIISSMTNVSDYESNVLNNPSVHNSREEAEEFIKAGFLNEIINAVSQVYDLEGDFDIEDMDETIEELIGSADFYDGTIVMTSGDIEFDVEYKITEVDF